jgi:hypothetical protein
MQHTWLCLQAALCPATCAATASAAVSPAAINLQAAAAAAAAAIIQALRGIGATRDIGNKLLHEEPQKPSDLPDELKPSHPGRAMDSDEKKVRAATTELVP